jgi:hypothetical protein
LLPFLNLIFSYFNDFFQTFHVLSAAAVPLAAGFPAVAGVPAVTGTPVVLGLPTVLAFLLLRASLLLLVSLLLQASLLSCIFYVNPTVTGIRAVAGTVVDFLLLQTCRYLCRCRRSFCYLHPFSTPVDSV